MKYSQFVAPVIIAAVVGFAMGRSTAASEKITPEEIDACTRGALTTVSSPITRDEPSVTEQIESHIIETENGTLPPSLVGMLPSDRTGVNFLEMAGCTDPALANSVFRAMQRGYALGKSEETPNIIDVTHTAWKRVWAAHCGDAWGSFVYEWEGLPFLSAQDRDRAVFTWKDLCSYMLESTISYWQDHADDLRFRAPSDPVGLEYR